MMLKTGKRENDVVFVLIFNVHRVTRTAVASKPRMSDNQSWLLGEIARFTSNYTCNHVYICTIAQKLSIFTLF